MNRQLVLVGEGPRGTDGGLKALLSREWDFRCKELSWSSLRPERLQESPADLLVAVAVPETHQAVHFVNWLGENPVRSPCLAVLPGSVGDRLVRDAARVFDDFMFWPIRETELRHRLCRLVGDPGHTLTETSPQLMEELGKLQLVGRDPAFARIVNTLPRVARSDAFVLVTGETGTGKELFARAIHHLSSRHNCAFVPLDCGAVPEHLFENELFGHVVGAYTDARRSQKGLVEMAEGGTLFLDEVDALPPGTQAKLLRLLQERTYKRLGEGRFSRANINIIAATNRDLGEMVRKGSFRSDLYYRLNVLQVDLPPLRKRAGDIGLLAEHFLESMSGAGKALSISHSALQQLVSYGWPGNVRELLNVIQRAGILARKGQILPRHLVFEDTRSGGPQPAVETFAKARSRVIARFEKRYVEELLRRHGGNITRAAREAGKERRAFGRLTKKHGIDPARL